MKKLLLSGALALSAALCAPAVLAFGTPSLPHGVVPQATPGIGHDFEPLRDAAERSGRTIGVAYAPHLARSDSNYRSIAEREFSMVTAENAMKWDATEPQRGQFRWADADAVVTFAQDNNADIYGHTLVWHSQLPQWATNLTSPSELRTVMVDHINSVAGRYAGEVEAWDVVNEAFEGDGSRRQSVFQKVLGDGYIEEAFRAARVADPDAKLCINDYSTDWINAKSTAIYNLVKDFKQRGVPIDCVGFQSHLIVGQVPTNFQQNLQRFVDLGVDVRITELDIRMSTPASAANLAQQAQDYRKVFQACWNVEGCTGVTLWGITDSYSWIPQVFAGEGAALPWNDDYSTKAALAEIADVIGAQRVNDPDPDPTDPTDPGEPTEPPGDAVCTVVPQVNAWNSGYTANLTIRNTGSTPINGWELGITLPQGHQLTQGWSAGFTQSGNRIVASNAAWNATINPGSSVGIGFNATYSGTFTDIGPFTLNGIACDH